MNVLLGVGGGPFVRRGGPGHIYPLHIHRSPPLVYTPSPRRVSAKRGPNRRWFVVAQIESKVFLASDKRKQARPRVVCCRWPRKLGGRGIWSWIGGGALANGCRQMSEQHPEENRHHEGPLAGKHRIAAASTTNSRERVKLATSLTPSAIGPDAASHPA